VSLASGQRQRPSDILLYLRGALLEVVSHVPKILNHLILSFSVSSTGSDRVDIYNISSRKWTIATLSARRSNIAAAVVGDMALFAGGFHNGAFIVFCRVLILYRMWLQPTLRALEQKNLSRFSLNDS
jgi:hypothetical protein